MAPFIRAPADLLTLILFADTDSGTVTFSRDTDWHGTHVGTEGGIVLIVAPTDIEIADLLATSRARMT